MGPNEAYLWHTTCSLLKSLPHQEFGHLMAQSLLVPYLPLPQRRSPNWVLRSNKGLQVSDTVLKTITYPPRMHAQDNPLEYRRDTLEIIRKKCFLIVNAWLSLNPSPRLSDGVWPMNSMRYLERNEAFHRSELSVPSAIYLCLFSGFEDSNILF